jgi:precorrin-6A/cobalt-precorrin-6A reductase
MGWIWLIGGTSESALLARAIATAKLPCLVTVTTESAAALYPRSSDLWQIHIGKLDGEQMCLFCDRQGIAAIVDASHPYAVQVSQAAIATATEKQIPYLRYERPELQDKSILTGDRVIELDSFHTLLQGNYLLQQRVLLAIGYQALPLFKPWQNRAVLFARILPAINSLQVALESGFTSDRLIAIRPPISAELEKALWQQWQISLVVTKANGKAGGEDIKRLVATQLNIPLIAIARPRIDYPQQTNDLDEVISFCKKNLGG